MAKSAEDGTAGSEEPSGPTTGRAARPRAARTTTTGATTARSTTARATTARARSARRAQAAEPDGQPDGQPEGQPDGQAASAPEAAQAPEPTAAPEAKPEAKAKAKPAKKKDKAKAKAKPESKKAEAKAAVKAKQAEATEAAPAKDRKKLKTKDYEAELARLQVELVKMQAWVKHAGLKIVVVFEGRDAAGKGGVIKRITEPLNPRSARVAALAAPTEREQGQWYFQRYVAHLPTAGEIVLFDRSWYNRAGVERVMGFVDEEGYREFLRSTPEFETLLQRSGIILVKYWFSVSDAEQERRFTRRIQDVTRRWKLSPMDLQSRARWVDYSRAKDAMFLATDTPAAPWWVVDADDKKRARLNCIGHLLRSIPYQDMTPEPVELPERPDPGTYVRPPMSTQRFVPNVW
jgi:polyphosphate kinase 2